MKNKIIAAAALALAGCQLAPQPVDADQLEIWTDPATGCRYLHFHRYPNTNMSSETLSIRFRADGTPDCPGSSAE